MEYPKMIYLGGDTAAEYRIVESAEEEKAAEADGFFAHDREIPAPADPADPGSDPVTTNLDPVADIADAGPTAKPEVPVVAAPQAEPVAQPEPQRKKPGQKPKAQP